MPPKKSIGKTMRFAKAGTDSVVFDNPEIVKPKPRNIIAPIMTVSNTYSKDTKPPIYEL